MIFTHIIYIYVTLVLKRGQGHGIKGQSQIYNYVKILVRLFNKNGGSDHNETYMHG